jgi:hypothetical protein
VSINDSFQIFCSIVFFLLIYSSTFHYILCHAASGLPTPLICIPTPSLQTHITFHCCLYVFVAALQVGRLQTQQIMGAPTPRKEVEVKVVSLPSQVWIHKPFQVRAQPTPTHPPRLPNPAHRPDWTCSAINRVVSAAHSCAFFADFRLIFRSFCIYHFVINILVFLDLNNAQYFMEARSIANPKQKKFMILYPLVLFAKPNSIELMSHDWHRNRNRQTLVH